MKIEIAESRLIRVTVPKGTPAGTVVAELNRLYMSTNPVLIAAETHCDSCVLVFEAAS